MISVRIKEDVTLGGDVILRVNFSSWWDVFVHEISKMVQKGPWWGGFFGKKIKFLILNNFYESPRYFYGAWSGFFSEKNSVSQNVPF